MRLRYLSDGVEMLEYLCIMNWTITLVIFNSSPGCISVKLESKMCPAVRLLAEEQ
jgi:hypothetical protein